MDIGFIGLGRMGAAMASNLLNAGHRVRVWNRSPEPVAALEALGAVAVSSPAEAFDAGVVFSMLADDASVRAVILDTDVLRATRKGVVHVNCATISVALARQLAAAHAKAMRAAVEELLDGNGQQVGTEGGKEPPALAQVRRGRLIARIHQILNGGANPEDGPKQRQVEERPRRRPAAGHPHGVHAGVGAMVLREVKVKDLE